MVTTRPPKTIVKPTALGPVANTDTKLLIYGLFQKGRVLAQDGNRYIESARGWTEYAQFLRRESSANHRESDEHQMIESHSLSTTGRLGTGDVLMPATLDKSTAGAFNDVYLLEIEQLGL